MEPEITDILLIGAGPSALALATRLNEPTPSALFTDDEHRRFWWLRKHSQHAAIKQFRTGKTTRHRAPDGSTATSARGQEGPSMVVLDLSGAEWMTKWNGLFSTLEIEHLRSPMFFHPDPADRDGLLGFVHAQQRSDECNVITGCVGREISKHRKKQKQQQAGGQKLLGNGGGRSLQQRIPVEVNEREREDYYTPGTRVFKDFCDCLAGRYGLCGKELIRQETVSDIVWREKEKMFVVQSDKATHFARAVVLAVGAGNASSVPWPFEEKDLLHSACHAFQSTRKTKESVGHARKNVLVIGGGLTSAQISDRVIRHGKGSGHTKVWHLIRGPLRVKPFDVDLEWMSKWRNVEKGAFWMYDTDAERIEKIKSARGGGSITPRFDKILKQHLKNGDYRQYVNTIVKTREFDEATKQWTITTEPPIHDLPVFDQVYFATGVQSDITKLGYLQTMLSNHPIKVTAGLPCLNDDLQWNNDIPLFVTGKFAALKLGPGAANLEGARFGAERVAWAILDMLKQQRRGSTGGSTDDESERDNDYAYRYMAGIGSRYANLDDNDDDASE